MNGSGTLLVKRFCGTWVNKCCKDIELRTLALKMKANGVFDAGMILLTIFFQFTEALFLMALRAI